MQFPERHPELVLYSRLGTAAIFVGAAWTIVGFLAGAAGEQQQPGPLGPWQLGWWEQFGWGYGVAMIVGGVSVLVFRALRKRSVLFGDRIRREYK